MDAKLIPNPEVREFILKVMFYWIDHYGIDGWRLDVADEVDPSVWEEARIQIKENIRIRFCWVRPGDMQERCCEAIRWTL